MNFQSCENYVAHKTISVTDILPFVDFLLSRDLFGDGLLSRPFGSSLYPRPTTWTSEVRFSRKVTPLTGLYSECKELLVSSPPYPLLSKLFFLLKELSLANFGLDSNGESNFLLKINYHKNFNLWFAGYC